jgi:hypothetical protein
MEDGRRNRYTESQSEKRVDVQVEGWADWWVDVGVDKDSKDRHTRHRDTQTDGEKVQTGSRYKLDYLTRQAIYVI